MRTENVSILEGNTFVVSDRRGDIEATISDPTGLFSWDTRFLSRWVLTVNGQRPNVLSVDDLQYYEVSFYLVPGADRVYVQSDLSVIRRRAVGHGLHEVLTILNHSPDAVTLAVRVEADADFADLFEVKDALRKQGQYYKRIMTGDWCSGTAGVTSAARRGCRPPPLRLSTKVASPLTCTSRATGSGRPTCTW